MRKCCVFIGSKIGYSFRSISHATRHTSFVTAVKPLSIRHNVQCPSHSCQMNVSLLDQLSLVRHVTSSTKQLLSFDKNSMLSAYLDRLVDCYSRIQQEQKNRDAFLSSNASDVHLKSNVSAEICFKQLTDKLSGTDVDAVISSILQYRKYSSDIEQLKDIIKGSNLTI